jgi:hypothetical protein
MQQIADWLEKLGMSEYAQRFAENRIDFSVLPDLTDNDLKDLGVVLGDRRKILRAITTLGATPETVVPAPKPSSTLSVATVQSVRIAEESSELHHIAQLRFNQPALSKADIVKLALKEVILKVESKAACKSRTETTEPLPAIPPGAPIGGAQAVSGSPRCNRADTPSAKAGAVFPDVREQLLSGRSSLEKQAVKGFRDVVREVHDFDVVTAKVPKTARQTREAYEEEALQYLPAEEPAASSHSLEPLLDLNWVEYDTHQGRDLEPAYQPEEVERILIPPVRHRLPSTMPADERERTRRPLAYGDLARLLVAVIMVTGVVATVFWQWSGITEFYQFLNHTGSNPQGQVSHKTAQSKISARVAQQQSSADARGAAVPSGQTAPTVGQRVVLYEEDPSDPQGNRYTGSAIWRTETVSTKPGLAPELGVRADVTIPERRMAVTWSLRRSTNKGVPGSYTIETTFNLPADLHGGGIANVPGILMKQSEQARGTALAGLAVKVMNGFFVIGLSADETDVQRNEQLLKDRSWFDIPIVYINGVRAILAMEKGSQGDHTFAEVFAAWEKK